MLDFYFIGTSGKVPQIGRRLASAMIRSEGEITLIDAGEGTQLGIGSSGWTAKAIGTILLTHLHADHVLGLAGVLLLLQNSGRTDKVIIAGPKGVQRYVNSLNMTLPVLNYPIYFIEFTKKEEFMQAGTLEVDAFRVNHSVDCYGYSFYRRRVGKFDVEKAENIPKRSWGELSKGLATLDKDGKKVRNNEVLGTERKGIKITYVTDTRPTESILQYAAYSDLFVCEGMYIGSGETESKDEINKLKNYHMTFLEAATLAKHAKVNKMFLTHFNPGLQHPSKYLKDAREIFKNTYAACDDLHLILTYDDTALFNKLLKNSNTVKGSITVENPYNDYLCFEDRNMRVQFKENLSMQKPKESRRDSKSFKKNQSKGNRNRSTRRKANQDNNTHNWNRKDRSGNKKNYDSRKNCNSTENR